MSVSSAAPRGLSGSRLTALRRVVAITLVVIVVVSSLAYAAELLRQPTALFDFKGGLYDAGVAILDGRDPYDAGFLAHQAAIMRHGGVAIGETSQRPFSVPLYPAPANVAVVPLSLLPVWLADALFVIASIAATVLALRLLGVRDRRCHALALVSWPSLFGLYLGALGPLLLLGAACAWRWRERVWPPAVALASIVTAKLFPWPVVLWLAMTRRWRALAVTVACGGLLLLGGWAVIGFAGFSDYARMLSDATFIQQGRASSLVAVLLAAGVASGPAQALALVAGLAVLVLAWWVARRRAGGEREAFGLVILAALTASPLVWDHYMVLLFVPIALLSPRYSQLWLLPLIAPLAFVLSQALAPGGGAPTSPTSVHAAVTWVAIEAVIGVSLWPGGWACDG